MTALYALDFNECRSENMIVPLRQRVSEAEYWEKYYNAPDVTYEWNNGELEEKAVSDFITILMSDWFSELLGYFFKTHPIGNKVFLEMGFRLRLPQSTEIRRPDLGIVLNANPVPLLPNDRSYKGTFDLCIEAVSDSSQKDIDRDTKDKKLNYAKAGVKEYYILDGHDHYLAFYRLNARGVYRPIKPLKGGLIKSTVLPGFQFRREDLFTRPSPDEIIDDPIYQGFVLPGYREAKQKAKRLAKKLRTLGIDPNEI